MALKVNHPDHTLITYPNLGHLFYPSSQWLTGIGPFEQYVLQISMHGLKLILGLHTFLLLFPHLTLILHLRLLILPVNNRLCKVYSAFAMW